jgi:ribosomal protein S18 acetylase RimI-like enzyme
MSNQAAVRRVAFPRDGQPVAELMELCFGDLLDSPSRSMLAALRRWSEEGMVVWQLVRTMGLVQIEEWLDGLGWYEGDRMVGNISITPGAFAPGAWLIGNVAVHPEFRRRGIASSLLRSALEETVRRGGRRVYLQVDESNDPAIHLYQAAGFSEYARRRIWERAAGAGLKLPAPAVAGISVRQCRDREWRQEYELLQEIAPAGLSWNLPLTEARIRPSFFRRIASFLSEETESHWLAQRGNRCLGVCISIARAWDEQVALFSRMDAVREEVETLLYRALWQDAESRSITLETDASLPMEAPQSQGFRLKRSLVWMTRSLP